MDYQIYLKVFTKDRDSVLEKKFTRNQHFTINLSSNKRINTEELIRIKRLLGSVLSKFFLQFSEAHLL